MPVNHPYFNLSKIKKPLLFTGILLLTLFLSSQVSAQSSQTLTNGQTTTPVTFPGTTCIYTWSNNNSAIGLPATGTGNISSFTATNNGSTPIKGTITATPLTGGYAYMANLGSNSVSVINTSNNQVVATVGVGSAPEGVAVTPDGGKVYVGNSASNTVSVINTSTNTVVKTITVGTAPQGIVVSPDGKLVYVVNSAFSQNSVSVINTTTNTVINTITVGQNPRGIAVSPDGSRVYASNNTSSDVSVINTANNTTIATIPVGANPAGIIVSPDNKFIYTANQGTNNVSVINAATNQVINTISVGSDPFSISESQDGKFIYTANLNSDNVSVINTSTNLVTNIPVDTGPSGTSLSDDGKLLYIACGLAGLLDIIDTSTGKVISKLTLQQIPNSFGNFIKTGNNCGSTPITFDIIVNPTVVPPAITTSTTSGSISACAGSPSASPNIQQFTVSGSSLIAPVKVSAPAGFQVSLTAGSAYANSVTANPSAGTLINTVVYVRSSASATGAISGNVILSSTGATSKNVAVSGVVNALPTVNTVPDQIVNNGAATAAVNFTGTANTFNWVNDTPGIGLPASGTGNIASFTAVNVGSSAVKATITATPVSEGYAYIANDADGTVSVINTTTGKVATTIKVGLSPVGVAVSPDGRRAYVTNSRSNSVSVINNGGVISTIPVGTLPEGIAISPDGSRIYVVNSGSGTLAIINTTTNGVIANIPVGIPSVGVTVSPDGNWLYVTNQNTSIVSIINATTNLVTATVPVGNQPYDLVVSPNGSRLYVANVGASSVSVINTATNAVVSTIGIKSAAEGIAISPDGTKVYIAGFFSNTIEVINTITNTVESTITTPVQPIGISLSSDGGTLYVANSGSNTVSVINTITNSIISTIAVGSDPNSRGNFITTGTGCSGAPITFTITVNPALASIIKAAGTLTPLTTIYGTPSSSENFQVSGSNLTSGILVTPPAGFEVSADNVTFSNTAVIGVAGNLSATTVYIRLAAITPVGDNYSGNIVLSTKGTADVNVVMPASSVVPALLTVTPDDKSRAYGAANPVLTANYIGFVNSETVTVLTALPTIETFATAQSPVGTYLITARGAAAENYRFLYNTGTLTITGVPVIPNVFTPNGDGTNDTWNIKFLDVYPNCSVDVYDRYGQNVHSSRGYPDPWNGTRGNAALPAGTYYYIINLNNGEKALSGYVAIIR